MAGGPLSGLMKGNNSLWNLKRLVTLVAAVVVALCSGTNYVYSAYAPQLGRRLGLTHTQLNLIALGGNIGMYASGPFSGRVVDTRGPRPLFVYAFVCLLIGYTGIWAIFSSADKPDEEKNYGMPTVVLLMFLSFLTGTGGNAGFASAVNATAKSFPDHARATALGVVISGFGLSAFLFSTISHYAFPGNTEDFLALLAAGTAGPMIIGYFFVRPVLNEQTTDDYESLPNSEHVDDESEEEDELILSAAAGSPHSYHEHHIHPPRLQSRDSLGLQTKSGPGSSQTHLLSTSEEEEQDVSGRAPSGEDEPYGIILLKHIDFWLLFVMMALLTGIGLMYINNAGSMAQALYTYEGGKDSSEAWQAAQVSTISVANFASRIVIGFIADQTKHRLKLPRSFVIPAIALFFFISQVVLVNVTRVEDLWSASMLTGASYGTVYVVFPNVAIEWFGITHFSENWGFVSLSPILGGNLFSLAFGRDVDSHSGPSTTPDNSTMLLTRGGASASIECPEGPGCYSSTIHLTIGAACLAFAISVVACIRDWKRHERLS